MIRRIALVALAVPLVLMISAVLILGGVVLADALGLLVR